ncbi:hypothetical protein PR048_003027 [Dryococelus australis]|uniref:Uncharacterized protein n=1 Tax=Dryococelus australis TaxID=614101 RepID=A0ABQ9ILX9_9NEOP|nr:hypothetical protein PR048_003027 [Dryococelus australis]
MDLELSCHLFRGIFRNAWPYRLSWYHTQDIQFKQNACATINPATSATFRTCANVGDPAGNQTRFSLRGGDSCDYCTTKGQNYYKVCMSSGAKQPSQSTREMFSVAQNNVPDKLSGCLDPHTFYGDVGRGVGWVERIQSESFQHISTSLGALPTPLRDSLSPVVVRIVHPCGITRRDVAALPSGVCSVASTGWLGAIEELQCISGLDIFLPVTSVCKMRKSNVVLSVGVFSNYICRRWLLMSDRDFEPPIWAVRNELHLDLQFSSELEWCDSFESILDSISDRVSNHDGATGSRGLPPYVLECEASKAWGEEGDAIHAPQTPFCRCACSFFTLAVSPLPHPFSTNPETWEWIHIDYSQVCNFQLSPPTKANQRFSERTEQSERRHICRDAMSERRHVCRDAHSASPLVTSFASEIRSETCCLSTSERLPSPSSRPPAFCRLLASQWAFLPASIIVPPPPPSLHTLQLLWGVSLEQGRFNDTINKKLSRLDIRVPSSVRRQYVPAAYLGSIKSVVNFSHRRSVTQVGHKHRSNRLEPGSTLITLRSHFEHRCRCLHANNNHRSSWNHQLHSPDTDVHSTLKKNVLCADGAMDISGSRRVPNMSRKPKLQTVASDQWERSSTRMRGRRGSIDMGRKRKQVLERLLIFFDIQAMLIAHARNYSKLNEIFYRHVQNSYIALNSPPKSWRPRWESNPSYLDGRQVV